MVKRFFRVMVAAIATILFFPWIMVVNPVLYIFVGRQAVLKSEEIYGNLSSYAV
jgi:lipopolysaccharide/colanic/teichoic acid biosynthesis glycosyltransferase